MQKKCHRFHECGQYVVKPWFRGLLAFCSEECRNESLKQGEPVEGWAYIDEGDELVYIGSRPNP